MTREVHELRILKYNPGENPVPIEEIYYLIPRRGELEIYWLEDAGLSEFWMRGWNL